MAHLNWEECIKEMDDKELLEEIENTIHTSRIHLDCIPASPIEIDEVNKPSHYTSGKIEVIDFIEDQKLGFCPANAIKYISRAGKKPDAKLSREEKTKQDLKKAIWYLERAIKEIEYGNIDLVCLK